MQSAKLGGDANDNIKPELGQWSTGLFDCCDDCSLCLESYLCPCIIMGQMVEIIDRGTTSSETACHKFALLNIIHAAWCYARNYRSKLRAIFELPEEPYGDTFVHCCCCVCAMTQEYRELKNRGADPSIGWEANVEKWKQEGIVVPPLFPSEMAR